MAKSVNGEAAVEQMTNEEARETILRYEDDILGALMKAADFREDPDEIVTIDVARKGQLLFSFHIHPLSEDEIVKCRKDNTSRKRNKATGVMVADSVNTPRFRSQVIYEATCEDDRARIWDNKKAWEKMGVVSGIDLIDAVLKGGEKQAIYGKVEEISGYSEDDEESTAQVNAKN